MINHIIAYSAGNEDVPPNFKEGRFLLIDPKDASLENPATKAQVLDLSQSRLFAPYNVHSILARGYWFRYDGDQSMAQILLAKVKIRQEEDESDLDT